MDHGEKIKNGTIKAKARGVDLGTHGRVLAKQKAQVFAEGLRPLIRGLMLERVRGPKALAEELNKRNMPTRTGGKWCRETVHRMIKRLEPSLSKDVKEARLAGSKSVTELMEQAGKNGS